MASREELQQGRSFCGRARSTGGRLEPLQLHLHPGRDTNTNKLPVKFTQLGHYAEEFQDNGSSSKNIRDGSSNSSGDSISIGVLGIAIIIIFGILSIGITVDVQRNEKPVLFISQKLS